MEVKVFDLEGQVVGHVTLSPSRWNGSVNRKLLSQAVAVYRTNLRAGLASTKRRGEVSGGGRKPWRQKHTGRARAGSIRSPLWRGGGSAFGPKPRAMSQRLPHAIRRKALLESLKGKLGEEEVVVLNRLSAEAPKTKPFAKLAKTFHVTRHSLIVLGESSQPLVKSLRNLKWFALRRAEELNALDVLNTGKLLMTEETLRQLEGRLFPARAGVADDAASH
jgi:large subunit ribosomal protein L4